MKKIIIFFVGTLFFGSLLAKEITFECQGAKVQIDMPENKLRWIDALLDEKNKPINYCLFWRDQETTDYSRDVPFGGSLTIFSDVKIFTKISEAKFSSSFDPKNDTWKRLKKQKILYTSKTPGKQVQISAGYFRSKYLAEVAKDELEEVFNNTISIKGIVAQKGVFVDLGMSLPYKSLTEGEIVKMMKSVEVLQGFGK